MIRTFDPNLVVMHQSADLNTLLYTPGSVVRLFSKDQHIFDTIDVNVAGILDGCNGIEAKLHTVNTYSGTVESLGIHELYYDGTWHNSSTDILLDSTGLSDTLLELVSVPFVSTGNEMRLVDCANSNVLDSFIVMQHYPTELSEESSCDSGEPQAVEKVSLTGVCHVALLTHDLNECSFLPTRALVCGTCVPFGAKWLQATSSGTIEVHSSADCTSMTHTLSASGFDAGFQSVTPSIGLPFDRYSAQLYPDDFVY